MAGVRIENLSKHYGPTVALKSLDLDIAPGEWVTLLGPSGCGKTTTLRMIGAHHRTDRDRRARRE
jgi:spermidine/putrescine transport system ATP-binding protein